MPAIRACNCSARLRNVSRSSPIILTAICARTPDSMWSRRCEIGWPTLTAAGSMARRDRMSVTTSSLLRLDRFRSTSISAECTPSACSSSSARPVRRPTVFTSGTCSSSRSARRPTRLDSASEMPGRSSIEIVKVPSLKGGRNERGSSAALKAATATAHATAVIRNACCPNAQSSSRRFPALRRVTSQELPWLNRFICGSR